MATIKVFVGPDGDSAMMETIIRTSGLASLREQTTLFVISTSQAEATLLQPVRDALRKASLPHVSKTDLPMVHIQHPLTALPACLQ